MFIAVACVCITIYCLLGYTVTANPDQAINHYFSMWNGNNIELAWAFTSSSFFPQLVAIGVIALVGGLLKRQWLMRSVFAVVIDLVAWVVSDIFKEVFHRQRPTHWFYRQETSFSYSSGHALHAVVVYGLWAFFFWRSSLPTPVRILISGILLIWVLGISWSRIALGVHYATDIIGGWLLGISLLSIGFAIQPKVTSEQ